MPENKSAGRCPINLDRHSLEHAQNWPQAFQQLRSSMPRPWTECHGGYWIATKYQDIIRIAQNPDKFFVKKTVNSDTGEISGGVAIPPLPGFSSIPNESDSPEWNLFRNFLNHRFGPKAAEERRGQAKAFATALIDEVIESGKIDFVDDLTSPLTALVTLDLLGFPLRDWRRFADPFHRMVYTPKTDPAFMEMLAGLDYYKERLEEEVALRRKEPKDDLLGYLVNGTMDGKPLTDEQIRNVAFNVLAGGVDTTTGLTSNALLYLSRHSEERQRLICHPEMLPYVREEFLRYYAPIHGTARNVKQDMELDGWELKAGERVFLCYASANRDEEIFEDAETLKIDRTPNRHIAFGARATPLHRIIFRAYDVRGDDNRGVDANAGLSRDRGPGQIL